MKIVFYLHATSTLAIKLASAKEISRSVIIFRLEYQDAAQHSEKLKIILNSMPDSLAKGSVISITDRN